LYHMHWCVCVYIYMYMCVCVKLSQSLRIFTPESLFHRRSSINIYRYGSTCKHTGCLASFVVAKNKYIKQNVCPLWKNVQTS
jgi:hypothetical protein